MSANLEAENAGLKQETEERWVMSMEDIRSLYLTFEIEKERRDTIVGETEAEVATILRKGLYAEASIKAKDGKVGLLLLFYFMGVFLPKK